MTLDPWKISTFALAGALTLSLAWISARSAEAAQPHMHAALTAAKSSREQLEKATPDKGGHRVKALVHINEAINEIQAGIDFDNKH